MHRFISLAFLSLSLTACISTTQGRVIMLQRGVVVTIVNECTPKAHVNQAGQGVVLGELNFGEAKDVPVMPIFLSGEQSATLLFRGYTESGRLIGSVAHTFNFNQNGTTSIVWKIGIPNNSGFGGAQDYLLDQQGRSACAR